MIYLKKFVLFGTAAAMIGTLDVTSAAAIPFVQPATMTAAAPTLQLARYYPNHHRIVRRRVVRRRYYGPAPAVALGLFGAALGAVFGGGCGYYYGYCGYPGYYYGPSYYPGPRYRYFGGHAYGRAHFVGHGGGFTGHGFARHGSGARMGGGHGHR